MSDSASSLNKIEVSSQGFEYGVKHFRSPLAANITTVITSALQIPADEVTFLLQLGSVYCNNQRASIATITNLNDHIRVHTKPRRYNIQHNWKERVVFDHRDFLVLNKPSGIPSHPSVDNQIENSLTQTAQTLNCNLLITHRLDTLTEGLIVYGKNTLFVNHFNKQLEKKLTTKKYVALVEQTQKLPDQLIHYMEKSHRAPKKVTPIFQEGWDYCELKIEQQKIYSNYSWIKINLLTGRTHQIRAQLSDCKAPIKGDKLYGSEQEYYENQIALRAQEIEFTWNNQSHKISLPEDFNQDFNQNFNQEFN